MNEILHSIGYEIEGKSKIELLVKGKKLYHK